MFCHKVGKAAFVPDSQCGPVNVDRNLPARLGRVVEAPPNVKEVRLHAEYLNMVRVKPGTFGYLS